MVATEIKVDEVFIKLMEEQRIPEKGAGLIEAGRKNIVVFAERMLGLAPPGIIKPKGKDKYGHIYSWQVFVLRKIQQAIENRLESKITISDFGPDALKVKVDDREFVIITSRQIGKSVLLSILSLWCCIYNMLPCGATNATAVGIVSASDDQAKKLLLEMKKMIIMGDMFMRTTYLDTDNKPIFGVEFFSNLLSTNDSNNMETISFKYYDPNVHGEFLLAGSKYGSYVKSFPPTAAVLGTTNSLVLIDEAGKTDRISDTFFYDYMYPTGNSTDAIRAYTSTPWVSNGFFYRLVNPDDTYPDTPSQVYLFTVDAVELENPKYHTNVMKVVSQMAADGKKDEVQRAYYCRFVKGEQSYFPPDDVYKCFDKALDMKESFIGQCDMGVDFGGQVNSRSVLTISYLDEKNVAIRIYCKWYEVGEDDTLVQDIADLKQKFNIQRIVVDDCSQGSVYIKAMENKGWDVTRFSFRAEKVKQYGAFRVALKREKVKSYPDETLKVEMLALEHTPGNRQSNIQHAPGYSDDFIDSFLMSCYYYVEDEQKVEFFQW